jgi:hypothetical protein
MVVRKARRMAEHLNVPIVGLVENMSGFLCPTCGTRHELFGPSHANAIGDMPLLARLPIVPELAALADNGTIEQYRSEQAEALAKAFLDAVPVNGSK